MSLNLNALLVMLLLCPIAAAQELEPKALPQMPVRLNALAIGYAYSKGNIILDQALPLEDVNARIHSFNLAFVSTFGLLNRIAQVVVAVPVADGSWEAMWEGVPASAERTGLGDPLVGFSINLHGAPMRAGKESPPQHAKFYMGGGLRMRLPLGQYDETKLMNLGTNRWMFEPSIGAAAHWRKWVFEAHLSGWFFTKNDSFFNGNTLSQNPLLWLQLHVIYEFRPGLWAAVSSGRSRGGRTIINGVKQDTLQNNSRIGATLSIPLWRGHGLNLAYTSGASTRYGTAFDTFVVAYRYTWLVFERAER